MLGLEKPMYFWPKFSHRNREHFQKGDLETGAATGNKGTLKAAQMHWRLTLTPTTCLMCYHCVVVVATPCLASLIFCTASSANFTYLSLADHYFHKCDAQAQASNVIVLFFLCSAPLPVQVCLIISFSITSHHCFNYASMCAWLCLFWNTFSKIVNKLWLILLQSEDIDSHQLSPG